MRQLRKNMFAYETLPQECKDCIDENGAGGEQYSHPFNLKDYNEATGVMRAQPSQVYLFTGNRCNLACETCDSTFSDKHAEVFPERVIPVEGELLDPMAIARKFSPKQWVVYGGEPFIYENIYELTLMLLQKPGIVSFLTNGMYNVKTHPVFQDMILPNHKKFSVCFSVDGDAALNEKIRIGASTKRILANAKICAEKGVTTDIHYTHSSLNSHGFVDFCKMLLDEGMYDYPFSINTCPVEFPEAFSPKGLPNEEKRRVIEQVSDFMKENIPEDMLIASRNIIASLQYRQVGDIL
ncbi:radical SAM protein [Salinivibrio sp. VYel1]|uniref:radical SAM protein n=1 Tax=Salinivibrio sp. VYel1 TaxID=2490490 RepID=UPI001883F1B0|nr:radical SAM protein [Salinivibrio sp. VYel1]